MSTVLSPKALSKVLTVVMKTKIQAKIGKMRRPSNHGPSTKGLHTCSKGVQAEQRDGNCCRLPLATMLPAKPSKTFLNISDLRWESVSSLGITFASNFQFPTVSQVYVSCLLPNSSCLLG